MVVNLINAYSGYTTKKLEINADMETISKAVDEAYKVSRNVFENCKGLDALPEEYEGCTSEEQILLRCLNTKFECKEYSPDTMDLCYCY